MAPVFPYRFELQKSGGVLVQFIDVPEAHTVGATDADAGGDYVDCLMGRSAATSGESRDSPPSPARGRPVAILPPLVAAKLRSTRRCGQSA
jgi:hypothetical protein